MNADGGNRHLGSVFLDRRRPHEWSSGSVFEQLEPSAAKAGAQKSQAGGASDSASAAESSEQTAARWFEQWSEDFGMYFTQSEAQDAMTHFNIKASQDAAQQQRLKKE